MLVTQVPKKRNEPLTSIPRNEVPVDTSEHPKVAPPGSSGQETEVSIDWEDLLIEYLILGGADMRMLEDGYYKSSLALHPVQSAEMTNISDNELMQYLRSKTEVLHTTSPAIIFCPN
jgi:hypothetical protein